MSVQEAAWELRRPVRQVYRLRERGEIAGFKTSHNTITLERASVRAYAQKHPVATSARPGGAPAPARPQRPPPPRRT